MEIMDEFQVKCLEILEKCGQVRLIEMFNNADEEEKELLAEQVVELDSDFPGGLVEY